MSEEARREASPLVGGGHASTLFASGRFDEAEACYRELNREQPEWPEPLARLGHLALLGNRVEEAIQFLTESVSRGVRSATIWGLLAEAYYRKGEYGSAAYCYYRLRRRARAATLAAMADLKPYQLEGSTHWATIPWTAAEPLPVVTVRVNERKANLVLDTGAGDLMLDEEFALASGVRLGEREYRGFAGGRPAPVWYGHAKRLALDKLTLLDLPVQVLSLKPVFAPFFAKLPVHGVLGTGVLSRFVATLDYRQQLLRLAPHTGGSRHQRQVARDRGGAATPLWMAGGHYLIAPGSFAGLSYGLMFLDTGMAGAAFALPPTMTGVANLISVSEEAETGRGGGGEVKGKPVRLATLSLGARCRQNLLGMVLKDFPLEVQFGFRIAGLVAHDFFRNAVLTLDFGAMHLLLEL